MAFHNITISKWSYNVVDDIMFDKTCYTVFTHLPLDKIAIKLLTVTLVQFHQWKLVNLYNFSLKSVPRGALIWQKNICIQNMLHLVLYCSFSSITRKVPFPPILCYSVDVLIVRLLPGVFGKWHILLNNTESLFSQGGILLPWSKIQYNKFEKLPWFSLLLRSDCILYSIWNICDIRAISTACISSHLTWYVPRIWHLAHSMYCWYISGMEIM